MKKFQRFCYLLFLLMIGCTVSASAQSYNKLWKQVEQAQQKSLPRTVIDVAGTIYRKAEQEKNAPQLLKAYLCKEHYQESLTPDSLFAHLKRTEQWAQTETNSVNKAILHSLLARRYAQLMQFNRSQMADAAHLQAEEAPADLREWSPNLYVDRIDFHCQASLHDSTALLGTSSKNYVSFVVQGRDSRYYLHDLYHLLATRAIDTYQSIAGTATDSLVHRRIDNIYRAMLRNYREQPAATDAHLLSQLHHLDWQQSSAVRPYLVARTTAPEATNTYLASLNELIDRYAQRDLCAEVYIRKATYLRNKEKLAEALDVCREGLARYAAYHRIGALQTIREAILAPSLYINTDESGYPGDSLVLKVEYRNLKGFTLQLSSTTLSEVPYLEEGIDDAFYKKQGKLIASQHFSLVPLNNGDKAPEDVPYSVSDTLFKVPVAPTAGVYMLRIVPNDKRARAETRFYVATQFKVLTQNISPEHCEITTLDARSGHPIDSVQVSFYSPTGLRDRKIVEQVTTDARGKALLPLQRGVGSYVARKGKDTAMLPQNSYLNKEIATGEETARQQLMLLTDRSLYRPGQTVYVKGIAYRQLKDSALVAAAVHYELALLDANAQEIGTAKVQTNEFGSFTAQFVLPAACLNGAFSIKSKNTDAGYVSFRVEEYKRPTFEIEFSPVTEAYRLDDKVLLKGNVKSFNGATVQRMPLAYTVTRTAPYYGYRRHLNETLLADTVPTDGEGNFVLPLALQAPEGEANSERYYMFAVQATLTGEAGETQTASYTLQAGPRAFSFATKVPNMVCKEDTLTYQFEVNNGQNKPLHIEGTYALYRCPNADQPVLKGVFTAHRPLDCSSWKELPSGEYQLVLSARDSLGREEDSRLENCRFVLFSRHDKRPAHFTNLFYHIEQGEFDAQQPAALLFGTSQKETYFFVDLFHNRRRIESKVMHLSDTIVRMELPYKESYGEGITMMLYFVKEGQLHSQSCFFYKRKPARKLNMKWEVFRDRLRPGQQEEWKLVIKTPQGTPAEAEMLATMYDASLDKLYARTPLPELYFPVNLYGAHCSSSNYGKQYLLFYFLRKSIPVDGWDFDRFYHYPTLQNFSGIKLSAAAGAANSGRNDFLGNVKVRGTAKTQVQEELSESTVVTAAPDKVLMDQNNVLDEGSEAATLPPLPDLRSNFSETAFFYPQLRTNEQGEVVVAFTMPQNLTRWNFSGYSHTKEMMIGKLEATAVTAKEFMVTPNMPRFVRTGDHTQIAAGIANLTDKPLKGTTRFVLFDPMTEKVIATQTQKFAVEAGQTTAVNFRFEVTDRYDLLGVRIVGEGGTFSDGEQHLLPVLNNKQYLTEAMAMTLRGKETRTFSLEKLFNENNRTATQRKLTVEFTANPAWYAVQALPTLALPANDNAIAWATAYYANSLAGYIANSQPRIKTVFDSWKATGQSKETLLSSLQKNKKLKEMLLEESPWVLDAATETAQRERMATLFDLNEMNYRNLSALTKLKELQNEDGSWSWCKGMAGNEYVTAFVVETLLRLSVLTGEALPDNVAAVKQNAFTSLHRQALQEYRALRKQNRDAEKKMLPSDAAMKYLYLVVLAGENVPTANKEAYNFFIDRVKNHLVHGSVKSKAQSAVILQKAGRTGEANEFIASIKEHLVQTHEMGAHFAFNDHPYNWGMMPVPTHVAAMEALAAVGGNDETVEEMKLWLLKQKQTTSWNSPVATTDAIYALLNRGKSLLDNKGDVRITIGRKVLETSGPASASTAGLGYVKEGFEQNAPELKAKSITVEKRDDGMAWGAAYAQYLSPIADVKQQGNELNVEKQLYVERTAANGQKSLHRLAAATKLVVGDKVVARLTIRLDRNMDFVLLKDQRGACFEPIGALSGYRWNSRCSYYVEVEDAATKFFFDRLEKGVYVLEHSYRVARGGTYESGLATLQCEYAPEYVSHSTGGTVTVQ